MLGAFARSLFGTSNDRVIKKFGRTVEAINTLEKDFEGLSDDELRGKTDEFRARLREGTTLDDLLPEAFAAVREAAKRTLGQRHFDVQLLGGIALHQGFISEMKTGEGKTLVATLPVYLNALSGDGVHVVTVNDYLASRDSEWMGAVYGALGLTTGCIVHDLDDGQRRAAYACDVTYGTNNELGFDYLRDNMKFRIADMVQRPFNYAIVDEVDSILIDEARTPLIISGPAETSSELYIAVDRIMKEVREDHYEKDEKLRSVSLTEGGQEWIEERLREAGLLTQGDLYDIVNNSLVHHVNQALRAHVMFTRDVDYIVKNDKVVIIDEFTGRMMEGRRYSEGQHQALEAKEGVTIQPENQTLASITFQNYFRLYPKLAGMTGTAMTEASEFMDIYGLDVVEVPTNLPVARLDYDDEIYRTAKEKFAAIVAQIQECHDRGQPVLVGTTSIEKSEHLAELLRKETKITPQVLNARYHEQEAMIVAQAGVPGAVTIATNMAGRGTDIQLGGNVEMRLRHELSADMPEDQRARKEAAIRAEVEEKKARALAGGGLFVLGTERHESRRIDNQLRGRSGRQGDPGASKFYLSLEDDLMRIFGTDRMDSMLVKLGLEEGEAITHPWINKALEKAQEKVEARNFDTRKNLLKFDDVMNDQRKVIYEQRKEIMNADEVSTMVGDMRHEVIDDLVARAIPERAMPEQWDLSSLREDCLRIFGMELPISDWAREEGIADTEIADRIRERVDRKMAEKAANFGPDNMRQAEKQVLLQILDQTWKEHLLNLDQLRHSIGLRAFGQKDPLNEYKRESFNLFELMLEQLRERVTTVLCTVEFRVLTAEEIAERERAAAAAREENLDQTATPGPADTADANALAKTAARSAPPALDPNDPSTWGKVPRNAPCPCGSGKKYKLCHGRVA